MNEDALGVGHCKPGNSSKELRVRRRRNVITVSVILSIGRCAKVPTVLVRDGNILVPSLLQEVGVVAELDILTSDTAINLENTMVVQA